MADKKEFWIHDTYLGMRGVIENSPWSHKQSPALADFRRGPWTIYLQLLLFLREQGWILTDPVSVRKHSKCLLDCYHAGARGRLRFVSEIHPGQSHFEFYEDIARDNPYGGRHTSNKLRSMSYLDRLRVLVILNRLKSLLLAAGFEDGSKKEAPQGGLAYRDWLWERWGPGREDVYLNPQPYNCRDRDGVVMKNGDFRYFRDYKGRIGQGHVWHDGNSMWAIIPNEASGTRQASSNFFSHFDSRQDPSRLYLHPRQRVAEALNRAIEKRDFRRATKIQDYIDRTYAPGRPKVGDTVRIQSSRYHGISKVEEASALGVSCNLGSGLRWFEYATVGVV